MEIIINIFGWVGMLLVIAGYYLVSTGKIEGQSYQYQTINIIGALCLGINAYYYGAMPSVTLNIVWLIIGFTVINKLNHQKHSTNNKL